MTIVQAGAVDIDEHVFVPEEASVSRVGRRDGGREQFMGTGSSIWWDEELAVRNGGIVCSGVVSTFQEII